jgi:hypothetical protein
MSSLKLFSRRLKPEPAWRRALKRLGPYQSLVLLAVPLCIVEPLKLVAVAVAGKDHWITGTGMIIAAYAASLLVVEWLFVIVKPKLLTLEWFARIWTCFVALRERIAGWFLSWTRLPQARSDGR